MQLQRAPVWIALGSVNTVCLWLLLLPDSSLFMALICSPEFSFPCAIQSVAGLTELWERFHIASPFAGLASTPHLQQFQQFHLVLW